MKDGQAIVAANRFGLGAAEGDLSKAESDPREWLLTQLREGDEASSALVSAVTTSEAVALLDDFRTAQRAKNMSKLKDLRQKTRQLYLDQSALRNRIAIESSQSFRERLVHFWANHFAVSTDKQVIQALSGPFEQEAIRPHITGSFYDLLMAAIQHPAMLLYLDNAQSFGPSSPVGRRRNRGLNENLAREVLELHTVGVDGGYTQEDVTNFAKILTGWTVPLGPVARRLGLEGETFAFLDPAHEPGSHRVMSRTYRQGGLDQGKAVLKDLAKHPNTAAHLSFKLARHFVADDPPRSLTKKLSEVFLDTGGNLMSVYECLVQAEEVWLPARQKFKTPNEWVISALRGLDVSLADKHLTNSTFALGQPNYQPSSPAGWPDTASAWNGPSALGKRIEWANILSGRLGKNRDSIRLAKSILGDSLGKHTTDALRRAESNSQALTLLLMSPEFLRR